MKICEWFQYVITLQKNIMNKSLLIILLSIFSFVAEAKEPTKGYRGFVELNMNLGSYDAYKNTTNTFMEEYNAHYMLYGISTSHGYQFNPHLFVGAGVWIQAGAGNVLHRLALPVFIHGRTDWTFGKVPLYFDLRLGGTFYGRTIDRGDDKLIISPTVGYRLDWGKRVCANFGIGISIHGCDDGGSQGETHYTWRPLPSLRIGIEF